MDSVSHCVFKPMNLEGVCNVLLVSRWLMRWPVLPPSKTVATMMQRDNVAAASRATI